MAQTTSLVFNGGVIPSPSPAPSGSGKAKLLKIGEITVTEQEVQVTKNVICDPDSVTTVAPFMEVLTSARLAELVQANNILVLDDGTMQYLMSDASIAVEDGTAVCTAVNFLGLSKENRAKVLYPCTRLIDELTLQQVIEVGEPVETDFDLVKAYPEDTEAGTLIDKLEIEDTIDDDPDYQSLLEIVPTDGKVAINEDRLHEALDGLGGALDGVIETIDELDMDSVPHAYLHSTLNQSAGDSSTTRTTVDIFACNGTPEGDCFEFEQTTTIDDTPYGYLWIEPGTYLINGSVTLQWVGDPRGTFVAKVGSVMGENFDFSQEQEILRNHTKIVTIPNRMKLAINITYDAGTPIMGFWIQSLQVVKLAGGMSQTTVAHGLSLEGKGSVENPLDISEHGLREAFNYAKDEEYFATKQEIVPLATKSALQAETTRATQRENEIEELFTLPTQEAVDAWLNAHPEATTTVPDGSLTELKFSDALKLQTIKDYVTPEMFGAIGNGTTDDTVAIQTALNSGKPVCFTKAYAVYDTLMVPQNSILKGIGKPVIYAKANLSSLLELGGGSITINSLSLVCAGFDVEYGIYMDAENARFLFEDIYIEHVSTGIHMRSYSTRLVRCEVYDFTQVGYDFVGVSSTPYNNNTSLFLERCYARKSSVSRAPCGYSLSDLIYSIFLNCSCDHCETPYKLTRCQSISIISCGCENFSNCAIEMQGICRGIEIIALFAAYASGANYIIRCHDVSYFEVHGCYVSGNAPEPIVLASDDKVVATLPDIWRGKQLQVYRESIITFPNKITYGGATKPSAVYDGDMCVVNSKPYLAIKNSSGNYGFSWLELATGMRVFGDGVGGNSRYVIGLCELGLSGSSMAISSGQLLFVRPKGNASVLAVLNYTVQPKGSAQNDAVITLMGTDNEIVGPVSLDGTESESDYIGYRPVTFTYNTKKYAGIEYYCGNVANPTFLYNGKDMGGSLFYVKWYNQQTHTVLNAEVSGSISTLTKSNKLLIDKARYDSFGNLLKAPSNYPSTGSYTLKIVDGIVQWVAD